jgi:hypothetical protein
VKRRANPETQIQMSVADHLQRRGVPGLVFWHTPNGSKLGGRTKDGHPLQALVFKRMGVRSGVSDIIAVHNGRIYALELKAPGGKVSENQLAFIADMEQAGAFTCVCEGLDRALRVLETWGLLTGKCA